jgi:DNA primase
MSYSKRQHNASKTNCKKNTEALRYLKGRGVTEQTIADFRLGYAPTEWRFVADTCQTDADRSIALRAGLIKNPDGDSAGQQKRPYDRFRGRIMFPL